MMTGEGSCGRWPRTFWGLGLHSGKLSGSKQRARAPGCWLVRLTRMPPAHLWYAEMMSRMEAHPDGGLTAQDMEISCTRALEQAV